MTRVPLHAPRAAPGAVALRASDRRHGGLALGLAWLVVGAAVGLTAAGAQHPSVALGPTGPVATVATVTPVDSTLALPHDPMAALRFPGTLSTTVQMQPVPAFVGVDDPAGVGPAPAVDPAVARLLARLRAEAKGTPTDRHAGPAALVALDFALAQVGRPYVWGATGPDSYDCSGLTLRSYARAGVALPRVSADQHARGGEPVAIADLLPGDLVFFATAAWDPGAVHHVGMYVGRGLMVDAPHPGAFVRVEPVTPVGYAGAVRVVPDLPGAATPSDPASPSPTPGDTGTAEPTDSPSPTPSATGEPTPSDTTTDTATATPSATDSPTDPPTGSTTEPAPDPSTDPPGGGLSSDSVTSPGMAPPGS